MNKILLIDDNESIIRMIIRLLSKKDIKFETAISFNEAIKKIDMVQDYDLIITDLKLPDGSGMDILKAVKEKELITEVMIITAYGDIETAVNAMKMGAYDFIIKPFNIDEFEQKVANVLEKIKLVKENQTLEETITQIVSNQEEQYNFSNIIGESEPIKKVKEMIKKVSKTDVAVLITGESGVGKELVAHAIHYHSNRKNKPFIKVNCNVLSEGILESELFGHEKGAFTGAYEKRLGRFEIANGGTIFLDEIGDLTPKIQMKLLQVLQEYSFERVGGNETIYTDVRIIAATNQNIKKKIEEGTFREDLYYRINVMPIYIPPLRERKEDIPLLVEHYISIFAHKYKKEIKKLDDDVLEFFNSYDWPGNIRELEHLLERLIIMADDNIIKFSDIPTDVLNYKQKINFPYDKPFSLKKACESFEYEILKNVLKKFSGDKEKMAKFLGVKPSTLYNKLKKYGLN